MQKWKQHRPPSPGFLRNVGGVPGSEPALLLNAIPSLIGRKRVLRERQTPHHLGNRGLGQRLRLETRRGGVR